MRNIVIDKKHSGKRLDNVLMDLFGDMPHGAMYKAFRKRDIKVNGERVKENKIVYEGDRVEVFIIDSILNGYSKEEGDVKQKLLDRVNHLQVVYEDINLLIVHKPRAMSVHPDRDEKVDTLIDVVKLYLKNEDCKPALCHRLDRNTEGLVMIAKNEETLTTISQKMKSGEIKKLYRCLVQGHFTPKEATLKAYLRKDPNGSLVFISDSPRSGSVPIVTKVKVLEHLFEEGEALTALEVELVTGRTHQIRAHLAHVGHPILGDGKYGKNSFNKKFGAKYQELTAYKLQFNFEKDAGKLNYLRGRVWQISLKMLNK